MLFPIFLLSSIVSATTVDVIWQTPVNVTVDGNNLLKTSGGSGWNADAVSLQTIAAGENGFVEITVEQTTTNRMFGLSDINVNSVFNTIDYAIFLIPGKRIQVYENGSFLGEFAGYDIGSVLRVERIDTTVSYLNDGVVFFTSGVASTTELIVDTSIHEVGGTLSNVVLSSPTVPEPSTCLSFLIALFFLTFRKKLPQ